MEAWEEFSVIEELGVRTEEDFEWERGGGLKVSFSSPAHKFGV